jgi:hypothetical protein
MLFDRPYKKFYNHEPRRKIIYTQSERLGWQLHVISAKAGHEVKLQRYPQGNTIGLDTGLRRYDIRKFPQFKSIIFNYSIRSSDEKEKKV